VVDQLLGFDAAAINTLLDDLTNPEMVAIARSLKPTG